MLAVYLVLLTFGSYCMSAPAPAASAVNTLISEALTIIEKIRQSEFQNLPTPVFIRKEECIHKHLNLFTEGVKSLNHSVNIMLLPSLKNIQEKIEQLFLKSEGSQADCEHGEESLEDFKKKLKNFLKFINQQLPSKS